MAELPQAGELFEGKYLIEQEIGSGGFAAVFRAVDQATERPVAIKILVPLEHESDYSDRLHARFEREARLLAGLRSQHTVTLFEFGTSEEGLRYLVFEFVDGTTLRDLVRVKGRQSPQRVVNILRQVCTALHEAHQSGILHRDIKPANIMVFDHLEMRDVVKLLDFGIAKPIAGSSEADDETITTFGSVLGTPRYMSPEQLAHQELAPASDIYSLGLVAYELLTGDQAIAEKSPTGILRAQLSTERIEVPRDGLIPRGLRLVIDRMLEKKRDERYQDLGGVVRDLEDWDDDDLPVGATRLAVLGVLLGIGLLVAAFIIGRQQQTAAAVEVERDPVTFGQPAWYVPLDARGLVFMRISSAKTFELKGTSDPRSIPPIAREIVVVEREGVPHEEGYRWITNLSSWDGRDMSASIFVRRVSDQQHRALVEAQMKAIATARPFVAMVAMNALAEAIESGHTVNINNIGWQQWVEPFRGIDEKSTDGLELKPESSEEPFIFAQADALRAQATNDWVGVLRACSPFAEAHRFCARQVARAHLKRDELEYACYWFDVLNEPPPAGTECLSTGTRPSYRVLLQER